jgi:hypothetical protein
MSRPFFNSEKQMKGPGQQRKRRASFGVKAKACFNLSSSVTTDGKGAAKDYSVTAGTGLTVSAKGTSASVGGQMTCGPNGASDSDFSTGIGRDFENEMGGAGNVSFEAFTKRARSTSQPEITVGSFNPGGKAGLSYFCFNYFNYCWNYVLDFR